MHGTNQSSATKRTRQRGASLVEYVLLLALIVIACLGALSFFGTSLQNYWGNSKDCIVAADTPTPCP